MSLSRQVTDSLEKHLNKIHQILFKAFEQSGFGRTFDAYWQVISPLDFPNDDLSAIDIYYEGLINKIDTLLEGNGGTSMLPSQRAVLLIVGKLGHRLARMQCIILSLNLILEPSVIIQEHDKLNERISCLEAISCSKHLRAAEISKSHLISYFHQIGLKLKALHYLSGAISFDECQPHFQTLPFPLENALTRLMPRDVLSQHIDRLENRNRNVVLFNATTNTKKSLTDSQSSDSSLTGTDQDESIHTQQMINDFKKTITDLNEIKSLFSQSTQEKHVEFHEALQLLKNDIVHFNLQLEFSPNHAILQQVGHLYALLNDTNHCPSLDNIKYQIRVCCESNRSKFHLLHGRENIWDTAWMFTCRELDCLEASLNQCLENYTGSHEKILSLLQRTEVQMQRRDELVSLDVNMQITLGETEHVYKRYNSLFEHAQIALLTHINQLERHTIKGFISRYWGATVGGGLSIAALMTLTALASTNPLFLGVMIASGAVIGAAGGTTGALIHDDIDLRRQKRTLLRLEQEKAQEIEAKSKIPTHPYGVFKYAERPISEAALSHMPVASTRKAC